MPYFAMSLPNLSGIIGKIAHWSLTIAVRSFLDFALHLITNKTTQNLEYFFASIWAIWYNRNQIIHNEACLSPMQVWQIAKCIVEDFIEAATIDFPIRRPVPTS